MAATTWTDINNSGLPGWSDVLRPVTITGTAVFGDANFGVTAFAGDVTLTYYPVVSSWAAINNAQSAGWAVVNTA